MKKLLIAALLTASFAAHAQYMGTLPPNLEGGVTYTHDSDKFNTASVTVGGAIANGFGLKYTEGRGWGNSSTVATMGSYIVPDNKVVTAPMTANRARYESRALSLTHVTVTDNVNLTSSVGFRRTDFSGSVDTISPSGNVRYIDDKSATSTSLVGNMDLRLIMTDRLTIGATASRDVVESLGNIVRASSGQGAITATTVAFDADYLITENLLTFNQLGFTRYSDNNNRVFFNTKTSYTIVPSQGVSVYLRGKYQQNSKPSSGQCVEPTNNEWYCVIAPYFSPDSLYALLPGVQWRKPHNGLVYTAALEAGRQWVSNGNETTSSPAYAWRFGVQTSPGRKTGTTFGADVMGSNNSATGGGSDYKWVGLFAWMKVPF